LYRLENRGWPWQRELFRPGILFDWASVAWAVLVIFFFWLQSNFEVKSRGLMDSQAVAAGQWWRLFTAIWLHADAGHLATNVSLGVVLLGFALGRYGTGVGMLAAYLAGAAGNVFAGWTSAGAHKSLGASGLVMGALGLLAVQSLPHWRRSPPSARLAFSGLLAGVFLFLLLGLSPGSDVAAHLGGFAAGAAMGASLGQVSRHLQRTAINLVCGCLFAALTILPWWFALAREEH
jgi:membrane associated rhomboid family serine protease